MHLKYAYKFYEFLWSNMSNNRKNKIGHMKELLRDNCDSVTIMACALRNCLQAFNSWMLNLIAVIHNVADYVRQNTDKREHCLFLSTFDDTKKSELNSCELLLDNKFRSVIHLKYTNIKFTRSQTLNFANSVIHILHHLSLII